MSIPPLGYVDDVVTISNCGNDAVATNAIVNAFTESKKLEYSENKCKKMHIGKKNNICPELKVHEKSIKVSECEKYLGDLISNTAKNKPNIISRRDKGYGKVSDILSILAEVPLGKYRTQMALKLRQAMLINGMLQNSEAWSNLTLQDIEILEEVDEFLLRSIFKAHSKTPKEFLHLETGTKPIRFIIASRRLNYFHNIIKRSNNELTKQVYEAQKLKTTKGDWVELVQKDFELIGEPFDEEKFTKMSKYQCKKFVKERTAKAAFNYLENLKSTHSKIKQIRYKKLSPQSYILSDKLSNEDVIMLFGLRSRMTQVKRNFPTKYKDNLECMLGCTVEETQSHLLDCSYILDKMEDKSILAECEYSDLFKNDDDQIKITKIFSEIIKIRDTILETKQQQQ